MKTTTNDAPDLFEDLIINCTVPAVAETLKVAPAVQRRTGTSTVTLIHDDCIAAMRAMPDNSVDSIVTDPPYGLGFMGKAWDELPPGLDWAIECHRVLKPGGYLLAFGGTRTWHRLAVAIEDAGMEIRDSLSWNYASGFPKSMSIDKAIDKEAGATREVVGVNNNHRAGAAEAKHNGLAELGSSNSFITAPATPEAKQWQGWGTALKPAFEPIVMARKPLSEKTVAKNVLLHGTGVINIDASRIGTSDGLAPYVDRPRGPKSELVSQLDGHGTISTGSTAGRFPANVLFDEFTAGLLDAQSGITSGKIGMTQQASTRGLYEGGSSFGDTRISDGVSDQGGASRFFFVSKASKKERPVVDGVAHETVKPIDVMRYLVKMVTPPGGVVLEPFAGSGTTVEAALIEGFDIIAIEREERYLPLIKERMRRQGVV